MFFSFRSIDGVEEWAMIGAPIVAAIFGFSAIYVGLMLRIWRLRIQHWCFQRKQGETLLGVGSHFFHSNFFGWSKVSGNLTSLHLVTHESGLKTLEFGLKRAGGVFLEGVGNLRSNRTYIFDVPVPEGELDVADEFLSRVDNEFRT